mmetsp:Transcript_22969/g.66500  ORF Transcript_22969/g.66500 Transcript_22969/m.66500 type:complete len:263 (+) Transcript_22969:667-1455(+)
MAQQDGPHDAPHGLCCLLHRHDLAAVLVRRQGGGDRGNVGTCNCLAHVHGPHPEQGEPQRRRISQHHLPEGHDGGAQGRRTDFAKASLQGAVQPDIGGDQHERTDADGETYLQRVHAVGALREDAVQGEDRGKRQASEEFDDAHSADAVLEEEGAQAVLRWLPGVPRELHLLPDKDRALRQVQEGQQARDQAKSAIDFDRRVQSQTRKAPAEAGPEGEGSAVRIHEVPEIPAAVRLCGYVGHVDVCGAADSGAGAREQASRD